VSFQSANPKAAADVYQAGQHHYAPQQI
jgi:hypothetical protein